MIMKIRFPEQMLQETYFYLWLLMQIAALQLTLEGCRTQTQNKTRQNYCASIFGRFKAALAIVYSHKHLANIGTHARILNLKLNYYF